MSHRLPGRRKPYTQRGVTRLTCCVRGCQSKAHASWNVCADKGMFRPICQTHDIELNRMVLEWIGDPEADVKLAKYTGAGR